MRVNAHACEQGFVHAILCIRQSFLQSEDILDSPYNFLKVKTWVYTLRLGMGLR